MRALVVAACILISVAFVFARTQCEPTLIPQDTSCINYRLATSLIYGGAIGLVAGLIGLAFMPRR